MPSYAADVILGLLQACHAAEHHLVIENISSVDARMSGEMLRRFLDLVKLDGVILVPPLCDIAWVLDLLDNVVILVEDDPPDSDPDLLGVYEGYALTSRGWDYAGVLPDRIIIFRNPILDLCTSEDEVIEEVAVTVVHEIAHHFGIDDARLDELGWG